MNKKSSFKKLIPLLLAVFGLIGGIVARIIAFGNYGPPVGVTISTELFPFVLSAILPILVIVLISSPAAGKAEKPVKIIALIFTIVQAAAAAIYLIVVLSGGVPVILQRIPGYALISNLYVLFSGRFSIYGILGLLANASYIAATLLCFLLLRGKAAAYAQPSRSSVVNAPMRGGKSVGALGVLLLILSFVVEGIYMAVGTGGDIGAALDFLGSPLSTAMLVLSGALFFLGIVFIVRGKGASIQAKMVSLGTLSGKSYSEISAVVGPANSVSSRADASGNKVILRQWIAPSYHIALLFDQNDICLGVSSETSV